MKIFALQTDLQKLIKSFLSSDEQVVATVRFSAFLFVLRTIRAVVFTVLLLGAGIGLTLLEVPALWTWPVIIIVWMFWVLLRWVSAYIDWRYDILIVTTEEIVVVNQSSIIHATAQQMNLDNIASVSSETQYGNLFPFGKLKFELKEGTGKAMILSYIPSADRVASIISDAMVSFQRRRATATHVQV